MFSIRGRQKIFTGIFLSLCLFSFIIISISIVTITVSYEKKTIDRMYLNYRYKLEQFITIIDTMHSSMRAYILQLFLDKEISKIRNIQSPDFLEINNAVKNISTSSAILPYVKSVYVYNHLSKTIYAVEPYGAGEIEHLNNFYDLGIVPIINQINSVKSFIPFKRSIMDINSNGDLYKWEGLTYVFHNDHTETKPSEGAIILNVSKIRIEDMIHKSENSNGIETLILNEKGNSILNLNIDSQFNSFHKIFSIINAKPGSSGYFTYKKSDNNALIFYAKYQPYNWTFINAIPIRNMMSDIYKTRFLAFISGLITLIFVMFLAYLLSNQIYKPISSIVEKAGKLEKDALFTQRLRKKQFLYTCLVEKINYLSEQDFREHSIQEDFYSKYRLLLFSIDDFNFFTSRFNIKKRDKIKEEIAFYLKETLNKNNILDIINTAKDKFTIILIAPGELKPYPDLEKKIKKIQYFISQNYDFTVSVTISPLINNLSEIGESYRIIQNASYNRFFSGYECIINAVITDKTSRFDFHYPIIIEKSILDAFIQGNLDEMLYGFEDFLETYSDSTMFTVKDALLRLCSSVFFEIEKLNRPIEEPFPMCFENTFNSIENSDLLQTIKETFYIIFNTIRNIRESQKKQKQHWIVENVKSVIINEFSNPQLGLDLISDHIGVSVGYIGRIFKSITGDSIVDFINKTRIKYACDLLNDSNQNVNEIIQKSGYSNSQHFHRVFKKVTRTSPLEYRSCNS